MQYPTYNPLSDVTPLAAEELAALDTLLQNLPANEAMTLDGMDGYLTALVLAPAPVLATLPTAEWLPLVWGGDTETDADGGPAPFKTSRQRKNTVVQVLRHMRHIHHQLTLAQDTPQAWEPIFSVAEQGAVELVDARDWCTGFLQAVDLLPSAWDGAWPDASYAPLLQLGGGLEGVALSETEATATDVNDPQVCDALSRAVPDAVLKLAAYFKG
jgi:uncharacterized protein